MSDEKRSDQVVRLRKEGLSTHLIAMRLGVGEDYVRRVLREAIPGVGKYDVSPYEFARKNWERARLGARDALNSIARAQK